MNHFSDSDQSRAIQRDRARYRNDINGTSKPYAKWVDERTGQKFWERADGAPVDEWGQVHPGWSRPGNPLSVDADAYGYAGWERSGDPFSVDADSSEFGED